MLTKDATIQIKAGPADGLVEGQFVAYASVFGNIDSYGDIMVRGAFANTLDQWQKSGNPIPLLFGHEMSDPDYNIGYVMDATEDAVGLRVTCQLDLENPKAKQVYRLIKGRRVDQMSFAYDVIKSTENYGPGEAEVNEILEVKLYEVSVVTVGANQLTEIVAVKNMPIFADRLVTDVKAGRVLSAKNESELRSAHEALGRVLSVLDGTPDEQKASEPDPSRQSHDDTPVKSAPTVAPEVVGDEIEDEDVSEEEIREASPTPSVDYSALPDAIFGEVLAEIA